MAGLADAAGRDADLRLPGGEETRAVRPEEARLFPPHVAAYLDHIENGNVLGDADDEIEFRVDRLEDGVRSKARGDVDDGDGCAGRIDRILDGVEYGDAERRLSRLAGGDAGDNLRAVFEHLLRVEHRRCAGDALDDDFGVLINQN